jgi:hypothetical protein
MPGSGAGSNLLNAYLLSNVSANNTAYTTPTTGYGTFGLNDSGGFAAELRGFSKFRITVEQAGTVAPTGYSIGIYVTSSPAAFQTYMYALQGRTPTGISALPFGGTPNMLGAAPSYQPGIPAGAWVLAEGPSDQGGTGGVSNPIVPANPQLTISGGIVAIRAVLLTAPAAGSLNVALLGIP